MPLVADLAARARGRYLQYQLDQFRKAGLQAPADLRVDGLPDFGSEPWLISLGRHVRIGRQVTFVTHDGGTWVFREEQEFEGVVKFGRITVYDNCYLGFRAVIMPGVTIGPNAVVGAGAVVTRDVPPDTVVMGVPARSVMSLAEYAQQAAERIAPVDRQALRDHPRAELLRLYPYPW